MGRLRRRQLIPEDESIRGIIKEPKIVHGRFGRQVEYKVLVTTGDYKGTEFRGWFSFAVDQTDGEEFIPFGGPLYQALSMVDATLDDVLDDEDLTEKKYQAWIKKTVAKLEGFEIVARVGIKEPKNNPEKKSNTLQPGSFGPVQDADEGFEDLDMTPTEAEKAPF